jgi:hypothetical protein
MCRGDCTLTHAPQQATSCKADAHLHPTTGAYARFTQGAASQEAASKPTAAATWWNANRSATNPSERHVVHGIMMMKSRQDAHNITMQSQECS